MLQETPPPWVPAVTQHTTDGAADEAELHMVRAVDTGVINVRIIAYDSMPFELMHVLDRARSTRIRR